MSMERPRLVWAPHHCSAVWNAMKLKDYLWISEPQCPCSDDSSHLQIDQSMLSNVHEFSGKFCLLTTKNMGVVRGELMCDFTASISIVGNRNNSLLLLKVWTRENISIGWQTSSPLVMVSDTGDIPRFTHLDFFLRGWGIPISPTPGVLLCRGSHRAFLTFQSLCVSGSFFS